MRTDARIDKYPVPCPNTEALGYHRLAAHFGSIIQYKEHYTDGSFHYCYGRVAGRVHYAPALGETPEIKNWLLVVALGSGLTFTMERWVNPVDVVAVYNPQDYGGRDFAKFFAFFFGADWCNQKPQELRAWVSSGYHQFEDYQKSKRSCTCHPSDNPPKPCAQKYALSDCRKAVKP